MIFWTLLTWLLIPFFSYKFGFTGMAVGTAIIGCTSFIPMILVRKVVPYSLLGVYRVLLATVVMGALLVGGRVMFRPSWVSLILLGTLGMATYLWSLYFLTGGAIVGEGKSLLLLVKKHERTT